MKPRALGYLGVNAKSLADWADYATRLAGMQIADKAGGSMALRMDDRKQRLVIEENGGDGVAYFGWEMDDAEALGAFCATLDKAGVKAAMEFASVTIADHRGRDAPTPQLRGTPAIDEARLWADNAEFLKKALDVPAVRVVKIEDPGALELDTTGKAKAVTPGDPHVVAVPL